MYVRKHALALAMAVLFFSVGLPAATVTSSPVGTEFGSPFIEYTLNAPGLNPGDSFSVPIPATQYGFFLFKEPFVANVGPNALTFIYMGLGESNPVTIDDFKIYGLSASTIPATITGMAGGESISSPGFVFGTPPLPNDPGEVPEPSTAALALAAGVAAFFYRKKQ